MVPRRAPPPRAPVPAGAEARGKQVLLYEPLGPLGGTFTCSRCGAAALQPDLLDLRPDCAYVSGFGDLRA